MPEHDPIPMWQTRNMVSLEFRVQLRGDSSFDQATFPEVVIGA
jgi:hypothetical protein